MTLSLRHPSKLLLLAVLAPLVLTGCTDDKTERGHEKGISKLEHDKSDRKGDRQTDGKNHRRGPGEGHRKGDGTKWTKPAREGGAASDPAKRPAPPTGPAIPAPVEPAPAAPTAG